MTDQGLKKYIVLNPNIMRGKPIFKGTRIPVNLIVKMMSQGMTRKSLLKEYPQLKPEHLSAALRYAAIILSQEEVFPLRSSA